MNAITIRKIRKKNQLMQEVTAMHLLRAKCASTNIGTSIMHRNCVIRTRMSFEPLNMQFQQ